MDVFEQAATVIAGTGELRTALAIVKRKDDIVRAAYAAGFSKMELHRLTGLARSTIDRILTS